jgi:protein-disulfide isomerase
LRAKVLITLVAMVSQVGVRPLFAQPVAAAPQLDTPPSPVSGDFTWGRADAPVTITIFVSPTCPHCAAFFDTNFTYLDDRYVQAGMVRLVFREVLTNPTPVAASEWLVARCSQSGYLKALTYSLHQQADLLKSPDLATVRRRVREAAGLTTADLARCLSDPEALSEIEDRSREAFQSGVNSTPTFLFNGVQLRPGTTLDKEVYLGGELDRVELDEAIAQACGGSPPSADKRPSPVYTDSCASAAGKSAAAKLSSAIPSPPPT